MTAEVVSRLWAHCYKKKVCAWDWLIFFAQSEQSTSGGNRLTGEIAMGCWVECCSHAQACCHERWYQTHLELPVQSLQLFFCVANGLAD